MCFYPKKTLTLVMIWYYLFAGQTVVAIRDDASVAATGEVLSSRDVQDHNDFDIQTQASRCR